MSKLELDYCLDKETKQEISVAEYGENMKGKVMCPYCFGELRFKTGRAQNKDGAIRKSHFFHLKDCTNTKVDTLGESEKHRKGKDYLMRVFDDVFKGNNVDVIRKQKEFPFDEINRIADTYFQFVYASKQNEVVVEIQYSDIPENELILRHKDYDKQGVKDIWVVGIAYDKKGNIANKTLSLLSKISSFQSNTLLIDGDKLYIINNRQFHDLPSGLDEEGQLIRKLFPVDVYYLLKKQIVGISPINKHPSILKQEDLVVLDEVVIKVGKSWFINGFPAIYNIVEVEKELSLATNKEKVAEYSKTLDDTKLKEAVKQALYEYSSSFIVIINEKLRRFERDDYNHSILRKTLYGAIPNGGSYSFFQGVEKIVYNLQSLDKKKISETKFDNLLEDIIETVKWFLIAYKYALKNNIPTSCDEFMAYYKKKTSTPELFKGRNSDYTIFDEECGILHGLYLYCKNFMSSSNEYDIDGHIKFIYVALFEDKDIENKIEAFIEKVKALKASDI